ncbi:MAG: transposase [Phycisphaeraceae bacterium]|nr:transposase [Phycisphaeraceae bacterium]
MSLGGRGSGRRYDLAGHARFLTFSCNDRASLFSDSQTYARFVQHLEYQRDRQGIMIFAWVVMPEHVHLLVMPPSWEVARFFVEQLKSGFAKRILREWRASAHPLMASCGTAAGAAAFWQPGGGYDRLVRDDEELREKIEYTHHNPVKRGLVQRAEDWEWSSARWYAGDRAGGVTVDRVPW